MLFQVLNTSYLTDSYIVFSFKIESVSKTKIFGLKMTVKSGLEKIFLKFLAEAIFPQGGKSEIFFLPYVHEPMDMLEQTFY